MIEGDFRFAFSEYTDADGLLSNTKLPTRGSSGNALLYTAHYAWALKRRGFARDRDAVILQGAVERTQVEPGLYSRKVLEFGNEEQQGPDDYVGLISMCAAFPELPFARRILDYGRTRSAKLSGALVAGGHTWLARLAGSRRLRFVYNNLCKETLLQWYQIDETETRYGKIPHVDICPNWSAWLGRMPYFVAHAQFACRERVGLVRRLAWALSVSTAGRFWSKGTDSWILTWHLVATFRASGQSSWLCERVSRHFMERLFIKWPSGMNSVFAAYFGPAHPLVEYFLT